MVRSCCAAQKPQPEQCTCCSGTGSRKCEYCHSTGAATLHFLSTSPICPELRLLPRNPQSPCILVAQEEQCSIPDNSLSRCL